MTSDLANQIEQRYDDLDSDEAVVLVPIRVLRAIVAELRRLRASHTLAAEVDPRSRNADTQVEPCGEKIG